MSAVAARLSAMILALTLAACAGGLASAKKSFKRGDYAEAKESLVALEADAKGWAGASRAEYALYRGLTHHALGDRAAALPWLEEAKAHAGDLSADDRTRLDLALESLGPNVAPPSP